MSLSVTEACAVNTVVRWLADRLGMPEPLFAPGGPPPNLNDVRGALEALSTGAYKCLSAGATAEWIHLHWPRSCRKCGCVKLSACIDGLGEPCHWVAPDLCSECVEVDQ